jgi:transposase
MAMTIVESTRPVTGGVDTHADVHVAAAVDANGGVLGVETFATSWPGSPSCMVGSPGSVSSCGWGWKAPARMGGAGPVLAGAGSRGDRGGSSESSAPAAAGKSDTIDAIEAARSALSGRASGIAKSADGDVEAMRVLMVARRSARDVRIKYPKWISGAGAAYMCGCVSRALL